MGRTLKVISRCPRCGFQTESVYDLDVMAAHMWEEHGIVSEFHINGEVIVGGPRNPIARFLLRLLNG